MKIFNFDEYDIFTVRFSLISTLKECKVNLRVT